MTITSIDRHNAQLDQIRETWFHPGSQGLPEEDSRDAVIVLDGSLVTDIATFYIAVIVLNML